MERSFSRLVSPAIMLRRCCLLRLGVISSVSLLALPVSALQFTRSETSILSGYTLEWNVDTTLGTITIAMTAPTSGWVGIGIAEGGGMSGADILLGWIDSDGTAHISDRWSASPDLPTEDSCQSWELLTEECAETCQGGVCFTKIVATRFLDSGDTQ